MVPDNEEVMLAISGYFFRTIVKSLDHIVNTSDPKEIMRAVEYLKLEYDPKKGVDPKLITSLDNIIWCLSNLIAEYNVQAKVQKKSKVYDKTAVIKLANERATEMNLEPLTTDEIEKRQEMERLAKEKKDKEESNED